jgi:hypothetical protein
VICKGFEVILAGCNLFKQLDDGRDCGDIIDVDWGGLGKDSLPEGGGVSGSSSWRAAKRLDVVVGFSQ